MNVLHCIDVIDTALCDQVRQLLGAGLWFSEYLVSPTNNYYKANHHDMTKILLKVVLNTHNPNLSTLHIMI
jgi:hypothetical protein